MPAAAAAAVKRWPISTAPALIVREVAAPRRRLDRRGRRKTVGGGHEEQPGDHPIHAAAGGG